MSLSYSYICVLRRELEKEMKDKGSSEGGRRAKGPSERTKGTLITFSVAEQITQKGGAGKNKGAGRCLPLSVHVSHMSFNRARFSTVLK